MKASTGKEKQRHDCINLLSTHLLSTGKEGLIEIGKERERETGKGSRQATWSAEEVLLLPRP